MMVRAATSCLVVLVMLVAVLPGTGSAEPIDMVDWARQHGRLVVGPEHERPPSADWIGKINDDDWTTAAQAHTFISGIRSQAKGDQVKAAHLPMGGVGQSHRQWNAEISRFHGRNRHNESP